MLQFRFGKACNIKYIVIIVVFIAGRPNFVSCCSSSLHATEYDTNQIQSVVAGNPNDKTKQRFTVNLGTPLCTVDFPKSPTVRETKRQFPAINVTGATKYQFETKYFNCFASWSRLTANACDKTVFDANVHGHLVGVYRRLRMNYGRLDDNDLESGMLAHRTRFNRIQNEDTQIYGYEYTIVYKNDFYEGKLLLVGGVKIDVHMQKRNGHQIPEADRFVNSIRLGKEAVFKSSKLKKCRELIYGRWISSVTVNDFLSIQKLAADGDVIAQCKLAVLYSYGIGCKRDPLMSAVWMRTAANKGNAYAQGCLGQYYLEGNGVPKDDKLAFNWILKSANQGDPISQFRLSEFYDRGIGRKPDLSEAVKWTKKSAAQGFPDAQFKLAVMACQGRGLKTDFANSFFWFRKAADQGMQDAFYNLAVMTAKGWGCESNAFKAERLMQKSADMGSQLARDALTAARNASK